MKFINTVIWLLWCCVLLNLHGGINRLWGQTLPVSYLSATVDGDPSEWNSNSFSSELYKSSDPSKEAMADLYLRYDAASDILYGLVTPKSGYVLYYNNDNDAVIEINGVTIDPSCENNGDPSTDFYWINLGFDGDNKHAEGFEASVNLAEGTYPFTIEVRVQVENNNKKQKCGLDAVDLTLSPSYDYSNAPYPPYDSAANVINPTDLYMGTMVDAEDGITFLKNGIPLDIVSLAKGDTFQINISCMNYSGKGIKFAAWIDYNGDGQFTNNEKIITKVFNSQNSQQSWTSDDIIIERNEEYLESETTYGRFRIEDIAGDVQSTGIGGTGEVEDYMIFMDEPTDPVAVSLASFTAQVKEDYVLLEWTVESEQANAGYNLYRATNNSGPWSRINRSLIPACSSTHHTMPATYSYKDTLNVLQSVFYMLEDVDLNGRTTRHSPIQLKPTKVNRESDLSPFILFPAYPNPFNPSTTLSFEIKETARVTITIFNFLGKKTRLLTDRLYTPGRHHVTWNGLDEFGNRIASGVYLARIQTDRFRDSIYLNYIK